MEPKPAPPEEPDFDAPATAIPVTVNPSPVSVPAENTIDNVIEKPADPNVPVATEPEPEAQPESTPVSEQPEAPREAPDEPDSPSPNPEDAQPKANPDQKPEHAPLPELHENAPVPKPKGNGMAMIVVGTLFVVIALSALAVFAYMQSK